MRTVKLDDPKFPDFFDRFLRMLEYFTNSLDPIEQMRILIDKRHENPGPPKPGDRLQDQEGVKIYTAKGEWQLEIKNDDLLLPSPPEQQTKDQQSPRPAASQPQSQPETPSASRQGKIL